MDALFVHSSAGVRSLVLIRGNDAHVFGIAVGLQASQAICVETADRFGHRLSGVSKEDLHLPVPGFALHRLAVRFPAFTFRKWAKLRWRVWSDRPLTPVHVFLLPVVVQYLSKQKPTWVWMVALTIGEGREIRPRLARSACRIRPMSPTRKSYGITHMIRVRSSMISFGLPGARH